MEPAGEARVGRGVVARLAPPAQLVFGRGRRGRGRGRGAGIHGRGRANANSGEETETELEGKESLEESGLSTALLVGQARPLKLGPSPPPYGLQLQSSLGLV